MAVMVVDMEAVMVVGTAMVMAIRRLQVLPIQHLSVPELLVHRVDQLICLVHVFAPNAASPCCRLLAATATPM
jgi:hypothetical protein